MSKDHYIAQTYLKHFIDPKLGNRLNAYRKSDLKHFTPRTEDICREENWDTNPYFENERAVEEYLRIVEPKWNRGIVNPADLIQFEEVKYFMAGYIAVMATCNPTGVRNATASIEAVLSGTTKLLTQQVYERPDLFPDAPPLSKELYDQIMQNGGLKANVDPKHSHARMIQTLSNLQWHFYKSPWLVMANETESPFLTSDFPVGFFYPNEIAKIPYRYVALSPKIALLIKLSLDPTDRKAPTEQITLFPETVVDTGRAKRSFVRLLNTLTVQGAENLVLADREAPWILNLVKKYKDWHMDSGARNLPTDKGFLSATKMMPRKKVA